MVLDGVLDYLRVLNAITGVSVLLLVFPRLTYVWPRFGRAQRAVFTALALYVASNTIGSIELLMQNNDHFSIRPLFILFGNVAMLFYLLEPRSRYAARLGEDPLDRSLPNRRHL